MNAGIPHKAVGPHMETVDLITAVSIVINRIMIRSNNNIIKSLFIGHHLALEVVTNRPFGLIPAI